MKGLLPRARIKSPICRSLLSLIKTRKQFFKARAILIIRTQSILVMHGYESKNGLLKTKSAFEKHILSLSWDDETELQLQLICQQIDQISYSIKILDKEISNLSKNLLGYENIMSISGIGPLSASIILSTIDGIENFSHPRKLASYFGIVPKVRESNCVSRGRGITKNGSKLARATLVQSARIAIRYSPYLKEYYERIKKRGGSKKAIVACAHKYLTIIYETLRNDWIFEDFSKYQYRVNKDLSAAKLKSK